MPELRNDAISGRTVIMAVERAARPFTIESPPESSDAQGEPDNCPFCAGQELMTPPEVHRTGDGLAQREGWRVRVVPNLYPIVEAAPASGTTAPPSESERATGAHEVVILSPDHRASFGRLDDDAAVEVLTVIRDRTRVHLDAGHAYVQAFVNHGKAAGASIAHPHAQVVALDFVPPEADAAVQRFATTDLVALELERARRDDLVVIDGPAPAWSPFAAFVRYGMRVAHPSAGARFDTATDPEIAAVAITLRDALAALHGSLGDAPYNVVIRSAPPETASAFHWYLDIIPRTSIVAGFEEGTGVFVNSVAPEHAAELLRTQASS